MPAVKTDMAPAIKRTVLRLLVGAILGGLLGVFITGNVVFVLVAVGAFLATLFFVLFFIRTNPRSGDAALSLARIETIRRVGSQSNSVQDCELRLVVAPEGRAAYLTTIRSRITLDEARRYVPGAVIVVSSPSAGSPSVIVVSDPPEQWRAKAAAAETDPSVIPSASAVPPEDASASRGKRSGSASVALVLTIALGAALALIPAYEVLSWRVSGIFAGNWNATDMKTGLHQQDAVDQIAEVAGSYEFTRVSFFDSYVIVTGLTSPEADTVDEYVWRDGFASREGATLTQPTELNQELFDASELDFSKVAQAVRIAIEESGLEPIDVYPSVALPFFESDGPNDPQIRVTVRDDYFDASFTFSFDLDLLDKSGTAFERG